MSDIEDSLEVDEDAEKLASDPRSDKRQQREWQGTILHTHTSTHTDYTGWSESLSHQVFVTNVSNNDLFLSLANSTVNLQQNDQY